MAPRLSRVFRRVRAATQKRGLPIERVVPLAELLCGLLAGLIASGLMWLAVKHAFLNYRMTAVLKISVAGGRKGEAAEKVKAVVESGEFQAAWAEDPGTAGLRGARRLGALIHPRSDDVVLVCDGRPEGAAWAALVGARRSLAELPDPPSLDPVRFEERKRKLRGEIADQQSEMKKQLQERDKYKRDPEEQKELDKLNDRLEAANKVRRDKERALAAEAKRESALKGEVRELQEELKGLASVKPASADELLRLKRERQDLQRIMGNTDSEDCSGDHPVVKRLAEMGRKQRRSELPAVISGKQAELAGIDEVRSGARDARTVSEGFEREIRRRDAQDEGRREKFAAADGRATQLIGSLRDRKAELEKLLGESKVAIDIDTEGRINSYLPAGALFWLFLLSGVLGGALLAVVIHQRIVPMLSVIDDEVTLADKLGVPVLGKVPRLAALEHR